MKLLLSIAAIVLFAGSAFATSFVEEFTTTTTWTAPTNVRFITVEAWGGGGAGGGTSVANVGGGGGAGGAYAMKHDVPVTPGSTYTVTVGANKTGTLASDGGDGNDSSFIGDNSVSCVAKGGPGGKKDNGAGGVGTTTGSVGDLVYAGGSGGTGDATHGAAGGGAAGSQGAGNSGTNTTPGNATAINPTSFVAAAGRGGVATVSSGTGGAGNLVGGGGGGAFASTSTQRTGGTGLAGYVRLLYALSTPTPTPTPTATATASFTPCAATPTATATATPSDTPTPTATATASFTPCSCPATPTPTPSDTPTPTATVFYSGGRAG